MSAKKPIRIDGIVGKIQTISHTRTTMCYTRNSQACNSMKLRMVIGGWTDYYLNHGDDWVAFNVHGERVYALDISRNTDVIVFQWGDNRLTSNVGGIIKAMTLIDAWLEV